MKSGSRIISITGGKIKANTENLIIGVITKFNSVEGVLSSTVSVNGEDSTERIINMISKSRFKNEIALITLDGITLAGLNLVDINQIKDKLNIGTLAITHKEPHSDELIYALTTFSDKYRIPVDKKINYLLSLPEYEFNTKYSVYIQSNISKKDYLQLLKYAIAGLRLSHIISSGITNGESKGRI